VGETTEVARDVQPGHVLPSRSDSSIDPSIDPPTGPGHAGRSGETMPPRRDVRHRLLEARTTNPAGA